MNKNWNFQQPVRGQNGDYRIPPYQNTTLRPTIFRHDEEYEPGEWNDLVKEKYNRLRKAETLLARRWPTEGDEKRKLVRSSVVRWAVLQHYEVCDTPLLDVSQSLRVAASFASLPNPSGESTDDTLTDEAFLMVIAVPQIAGVVTSCAFDEIQALRLSSLCPSNTMRAHLQEGYLIGEYPELRTAPDKQNLGLSETDFGKRLIAKFRFRPNTFWEEDRGAFSRIHKHELYPNVRDELYDICCQIEQELPENPTVQ